MTAAEDVRSGLRAGGSRLRRRRVTRVFLLGNLRGRKRAPVSFLPWLALELFFNGFGALAGHLLLVRLELFDISFHICGAARDRLQQLQLIGNSHLAVERRVLQAVPSGPWASLGTDGIRRGDLNDGWSELRRSAGSLDGNDGVETTCGTQRATTSLAPPP